MTLALSNSTLSELPDALVRPNYDRSDVRAGIAHFGVGNFHRTHQAVYIDRCLHLPGQETWGIVGIGLSDGPAAREKAASYARQDGLYTVTEFAPDGSSGCRVIGSMVNYLLAPADPEAVLVQLSDPGLRIVSLTITEGGYNIDEVSGDFLVNTPSVAADIAGDAAPTTVFGFIVRALARRRDAGLSGFTVVSCDNLRQNGATAKKAVLAFARAVNPDLADWIAINVSFPNSMVDRIAPYVAVSDRERLQVLTGVEDDLPAMSESYLQWVIEDDFIAGRPAFEQVGVELRDDVALFETVKGRLLNASHVLMSYPSLLAGHRLVHKAMADIRIRGLLDAFMEVDSIPLLDGPDGVVLEDYKDLILDRFSNPAVGDQLIRIATDGLAKIPVFHAKTILELALRGADMQREAFLLACYQQYLGDVDDLGNAIGTTEPSLSDADLATLADADGLGLLRIPAFAPLKLDAHDEFPQLFLNAVASIRAHGAGGTLESMLVNA